MKTALALLITGVLLSLPGSIPVARPVDLVGRVTDAATGDPIPGVFVLVAAQKIGTQTDREGFFRLRPAWAEDPLELTFDHVCYHRVQVEVEGNPSVESRVIEVGLPFNYEKWAPYSPPLGSCRRG